jgi:hypothetical protein
MVAGFSGVVFALVTVLALSQVAGEKCDLCNF